MRRLFRPLTRKSQLKLCVVKRVAFAIKKWREYMQKPKPSEYTKEMLENEYNIATAEYKEMMAEEKGSEAYEWERMDYYFSFISYLLAAGYTPEAIEIRLAGFLVGADLLRMEALLMHNYSKEWKTIDEFVNDAKKHQVAYIRLSPSKTLIGYDTDGKIIKPSLVQSKEGFYNELRAASSEE